MKIILFILLIFPFMCLAQSFNYNATQSNKVIRFPGKIYEDVRGKMYVDSAVIAPYSSLILIYVSSFNVLPVTLESFTTSVSSNVLTLNWSTATESNNSYFIIEESDDGINWRNIKTIPTQAINGNSTSKLNYITKIIL